MQLGFRQALTEGVPFDAAGILVDEQFGAGRLHEWVDVFEAGRLSRSAGTA